MGIINPVGARLTETQLRRLEASDDTLRVQPNRAAGVSAVKKDKKPSKVTKTLGSEKAATGSEEDDQYDAAAAWEAAEQRSLQITGDWKIAARQAVKDARLAVKAAKDNVARVLAVQVREDAKAWKKTLRSWSREWARDAFLKGSKPTAFPGVIGAGALHAGGPQRRPVDLVLGGRPHPRRIRQTGPGGHLRGVMPVDAYIPTNHPEFHDGGLYFAMSGTSQSAAVVSGIVALMLQVDPTLTPDEVKFRLQASSRPAADETGAMAYSIFQ